MHPTLEALSQFVRAKFGLEAYRLERYSIHRSVNLYNETEYCLSMEWFPVHFTGREQQDESLNPEGTAVIDIDLRHNRINSILFVGGTSYASRSLFTSSSGDEIIPWVESETGLRCGEHFNLVKQKGREYRFKGCVNGVDLAPMAMIEVEHDQDGKLTKYAKYGHFPTIDEVIVEEYSLSLEMVEPLLHKQLQLMEMPLHDREIWMPIYGLEEIFVTNDGGSTLPLEWDVKSVSVIQMKQLLEWESPLKPLFERNKRRYYEELTFEQASSLENHPDTVPISHLEQVSCREAVIAFLRQMYPNDSGKWRLQTLHRENGLIYAALTDPKQERLPFKRKLFIMIDKNRYEAINYMDNDMLLEIVNSFQAPDPVKLSKDSALAQLRNRITLTPYYVFHNELKKYMVCGKLDCDDAVHASTGEIMALRDL